MQPWTASLGAGLLLASLATLAAAPAAGAADVPEWLTQVAAAAPRTFDAKVPAEVLLHDGRQSVGEQGVVESRVLHAVRVLTRAGRQEAVARLAYVTDADRVRELKGWVIDPRGVGRRLGKERVLDVALAQNDVYNEERLRLIDASEEVEVGSVFGFEAVVERRSFFNQTQWSFQSALPVRLSRLELVLPAGWTVGAHLFNCPRPPVESAPSPGTRLWELRDLPFLDDEPGAPELADLVPYLALSYAPPALAGQPAGEGPRCFATWAEVAAWAAGISDPRAEPDVTLVTRAQELTRSATNEWQRLAALARFVQDTPYISIQVGFGRLQPHPAAQVLAKQYGDCKDKVALLRALLQAVGIRSYPFLVSAFDRDLVRREWPSPIQFDHVVAAIAVAGAAGQPASIQHPRLGALLLFDPTDPDTRLGDLPESEQGGLGLLASGEAASSAADGEVLIPVPVIPTDVSQRVRETEARLSEQGTLTAQLVERTHGQAAAHERHLWRAQTRTDYQTTIERWLAETMTGVKAEDLEAAEAEDGGFRLALRLGAERYAQDVQGRLLVFKPALVSRHDTLALTAATRQHPVVLHARAFESRARIALPAGYAVDELPSPASVEAPFGSYTMTVGLEGEELLVVRRLKTRAVTLPPSEYAQVRDFFRRVREAESAPVVLARK